MFDTCTCTFDILVLMIFNKDLIEIFAYIVYCVNINCLLINTNHDYHCINIILTATNRIRHTHTCTCMLSIIHQNQLYIIIVHIYAGTCTCTVPEVVIVICMYIGCRLMYVLMYE